ncbi:MAG: acetoacetate--CoA ligase [Pelagibacteraceae bacterium TMED124]|nr:acetoacetate--CoA ligase [Candidatus Neomarinimicrobiota bacterium]RPG18590.1 MAG: acetoacetate--CoA ligase [Pelagibacteraceae bacterium TMED124]|tara:strand:- start:2523 stop:4457 length:1935 start_codon:yes stop_codon:yes gene_type:complete
MNKALWSPSKLNLKESKMALFIDYINKKRELSINNYTDLYNWSIDDISSFWGDISNYFNIIFHDNPKKILKDSPSMINSRWFLGANLNYAENMLRFSSSDSDAIQFCNELDEFRKITYSELYSYVSILNQEFLDFGVVKGDKIVAIMPNIPETIISSLACSSVGAVWSSVSPDFGVRAILDRFEQIGPKILIVCNGYTFKGKVYSLNNKIKEITSKLKTIQKVIVVDYVKGDVDESNLIVKWSEIDFSRSTSNIDYVSTSFDDPLYIMFSSGTTGKPKSIVHSVGGTLIQHVKELGLHVDLNENDKILYYTTCGWMMWNWVLSSLFFGATLVLYEGSPFHPNKSKLLNVVDSLKINVFGTSAKYISYLQSEGLKPKLKFSFRFLRNILSTGSTLTNENFDFVYSSIKKNVQLSSISGGTDIISCFALGNPLLDVKRGELQCIGLGMAVSSYDKHGKEIFNKKGELVCKKPFPSMPIYFWGDKNNKKYYNSYFNKFKNIWTHGDFIKINKNGGVVIFGRSDATLNPGGVRIGTSEIYSVVENLNFIDDSIAVNSNLDDGYILFVKTLNHKLLNNKLINQIKNLIKINLSPKHLPQKILQVKDIPYTVNGKKVEIAIKNIIDGKSIDNIESINNQECLSDYYKILK